MLSILNECDIKQNEPLSNHSTFKIGGPADYLVTPSDRNTLIALLESNLRCFVMGNGSNLLFSDEGYRGVVIKTTKLQNIIVENDVVIADSGVLLSRLANMALENSLSGLEFAAGIPGTLGAAVAINAGAYGGEMKDCIIETTYYENGEIKSTTDHAFGYRRSVFSDSSCVILESEMKLNPADNKEIKEKMQGYAKRRSEKQPLNMPSSGSTFKRPEGYFAGKLIEDCGLRGYSIGGAQVSDKHCGFIVNKGDATAEDVLALIQHIKNKVYTKFNVKLETEVEVVDP